MSTILSKLFAIRLIGSRVTGVAIASVLSLGWSGAIANEVPASSGSWHSMAVLDSLQTERGRRMAQVTSVSELSDVQPTDWAFQALQSLVERYGCVAGYPDATFRGNRPLSRYEFAAGLNACLDRVNELIAAASDNLATQNDLATLQRLQEDFGGELATLRGRIDVLEANISELEAQQFSTTTKLQGEVTFNLTDTFGAGVADGGDSTQTVFQNRVRLQLVSSFTGKDKLITRLTSGSIANAFASELGTQEGRFAYDGQGGNTVRLDRLHYIFPVTDDLQATIMAGLGGHHFYADTFNPGLEAGGGAGGALSRFGERNPLYRMNLGGQGAGLRYKPHKSFEASLGYVARGGNNPDSGAGLFNGNYSALAQVVFKPTDDFKFGLTYLHGYDKNLGAPLFGATGTNLGNLSTTALATAGVTGIDSGAVSNSYGAEVFWKVSSRFDVRGWFGLNKARLIDVGDADILNYALILGFPDLLKAGSFGAIIVGAAPHLTDMDAPGPQAFDKDVPLHVEALYKYRINSNILLTPGFIWLVNPNQSSDHDSIVIGVLRTTFTF